MQCQACKYQNPPEGTIDKKCDECGAELSVEKNDSKPVTITTSFDRKIKQYALTTQMESYPGTLTLSYETGWEDLKVKIDEKEIGHFQNREALEKGQTFEVNSDIKLDVKLDVTYRRHYIKLLLNRLPVKESASEAVAKINEAVGVGYFMGGFTLLMQQFQIPTNGHD